MKHIIKMGDNRRLLYLAVSVELFQICMCGVPAEIDKLQMDSIASTFYSVFGQKMRLLEERLDLDLGLIKSELRQEIQGKVCGESGFPNGETKYSSEVMAVLGAELQTLQEDIMQIVTGREMLDADVKELILNQTNLFGLKMSQALGIIQNVTENVIWLNEQVTAIQKRLDCSATGDRCGLEIRGICQDGWKYFDSTCYKFFENTTMTWDAASQFCLQQKGILAKVNTAEIASFLLGEAAHLFAKYGDQASPWIGFNDKRNEGIFAWNDEAPESTYSNWKKGEPNDDYGVEDCTAIYTDGYWNDFPCNYNKLVLCQKNPVNIRLVNGSGPHEGRVEILHDDQWGTICDDDWDYLDATVVCNMLGYLYGAESVTEAGFGEGSGTIWLEGVSCTGEESDLEDCDKNGWGQHDCRHKEDAGVRCFMMETSERPDTTPEPTPTVSGCWTISTAYPGHVSVTQDGLTCQRWDQQYPRRHQYKDPSKFPDDSLGEASNYCRDPSMEGEPWCYTITRTRWQRCGVPHCNNYDCFNRPGSYVGHVSKANGINCQRWDKQTPHQHKYNTSKYFPDATLDAAANFCRDTDNEGSPWCYTTDPSIKWRRCGIPKC